MQSIGCKFTLWSRLYCDIAGLNANGLVELKVVPALSKDRWSQLYNITSCINFMIRISES